MRFSLILLIFLIVSCLSCLAQPIQPANLEYKGAFRLPDDSEWEYSGYAMTYYPDGDPGSGVKDGYPGSLFIVGHDHRQYVSEVSIPTPIISTNKNLGDLSRAKTLQDFADIRPGMFDYLEIPRAGLAYLGPKGSQATGRLHFCWGQHFQDFEASHGWSELDISKPKAAGPWLFDGYTNYVTNDYLFDIPKEWADSNTPGQYLASGRFRDGHWGGQGPALFAYGPWEEGNPPNSGVALKSVTPLLLYGIQASGAIEIANSDSMKMNNFKEADEWSGGSWLTTPNKSAVIFAGTKATGKSWYGFANGLEWPTEGYEDEVYPEVPPWPYNDRGWWSEGIKAQIIFYDPKDLAAVAKGKMKTYEPQPYAVLDIDQYLFDPGFDLEKGKRYLLGAVAFDRANGILYIVERRADEDRSIVHAWQVR